MTCAKLERLLERDGWHKGRASKHGVVYRKTFVVDGRAETRVTVIPTKKHKRNKPIPRGTLREILGPKQTGLGGDGLRRLIDLHG